MNITNKDLQNLSALAGCAGNLLTFLTLDERINGDAVRHSNAWLATHFNVSIATIKRWLKKLRDMNCLFESKRETIRTRQGPRDLPRARKIIRIEPIDFIVYCQKKAKRTAQWLSNKLAPRTNIITSLRTIVHWMVAQGLVEEVDRDWVLTKALDDLA